MQFIYPLNRLPDEKEHLAGGKAKSLAYMMKNLKLRIPEGFVILSDAVKNNELIDKAKEELDELIRALQAYDDALGSGDEEALRALLAEGDKIKREIDK